MLSDSEYSTEGEGNCIRFFALQYVATKAMRIKIDKHPENFKTMWERFEKKCPKENKRYKSTYRYF